MSEPIWTTGHLKVRPEWITTSIVRGRYESDEPYEDYSVADDAPPVIEFLVEEAINGSTHYVRYEDLFTFEGEMNYGYSGDQNDELVAAGIAFCIKTDAKYEYDGDVWFWTPGMEKPEARPAAESGVTLAADEYRAMRKLYRFEALVEALDAHFVNPWELLGPAPLPPPYTPEENR